MHNFMSGPQGEKRGAEKVDERKWASVDDRRQFGGFDIKYLQVWSELPDSHEWLYPVSWEPIEGQAVIRELNRDPFFGS